MSQARLFGTEYETGAGYNSLGPLGESRAQHNVPCAVCATTARSTELMIPAKISCPDDSWTREYAGYLMTTSDEEEAGFHRTRFLCVDKTADNIPNSSENVQSALLHHVRVDRCDSDDKNDFLPCTYDRQQEITCVVCTK